MNDTETLQARRDVALFRIYLGYRTAVGILLLFLFTQPRGIALSEALDQGSYFLVALTYLVSNLALLPLLVPRHAQRARWQLLVFASDIAAISVLAHSSHGIASGLPILLIITVAAAAVLIKMATLATLVAALAALGTLAVAAFAVIAGGASTTALLPAGLAGMLMFVVSLLVQFIARRLSRAEALAQARAGDIVQLQRLNNQIVESMATGICLCDRDGVARLLNRAAALLLAPRRPPVLESGRRLDEYAPALGAQFQQWLRTGEHRVSPITVYEDSPRISASFQRLTGTDRFLVFLDDHTPIAQQAQSLKLSSLGRLTASIAHEIRNPLGAISHAAQLLSESIQISDTDRRMLDIIERHSQRVNAIIRDIMHLSGQRAPDTEYLALARWLPELLDVYLETRQDRPEIGIECSADISPIEFDRENLRRVLFNLLDNALRHSALATGHAAAKLRVSRDAIGQRCFLDVIDFGDGVPDEERGKLFEPFHTNVQGGTGLGLYMSKELCELNHATLSYQPTLDGQSCFRLTLRLHDGAVAAAS